VFRHAPSRPSNPLGAKRPPSRRQPPPRPPARPAPRAAAARQHNAAELEHTDDSQHESLDPDDRPDRRVQHSGMGTLNDRDAGEGSSDQQHGFRQGHSQTSARGGEREGGGPAFRHAPAPDGRARRDLMQLLNSGWPGALALLGRPAVAAGPHELLDALVAMLLAAARARDGSSPAVPPLTRTTLTAVHAHLERTGPAAVPLTLSGVKALLLAHPAPQRAVDMPMAGERRENAMLLLPLVILNSARTRTDGQRELAGKRLSMLLRSQAV